ncbi:hypothetical protein BWK58_11375 [Flavobacterium columnare]|nr:hypothetical protein BWK58_11375 [Flavobacterium columnare]
MSKWRQISIGEFIDFNPSESLPKGKVVKKIPMAMLTEYVRKIKGFEFAEYNSGPKFRNGDTLVAKITPCLENGKTAQVDILEDNEVAFGSSEFIVLRENEHSINDYIYYLAKSPVFRERAISCMEGTSGRKRVNEGALKRQEVIVPDKSIQQKIAKVLSDLDAKIELNNKINTELEAMAKTLYDYWFVQFDFPDANGKPYKSSGGKMVWNEALKREIPEGWEVKKLAWFINNDKSGDWGKEEKVGNYNQRVYCVRGADINGLNGKGDLKTPERYILEKNLFKTLNPHDLIVEISGGSPTQSTGRLAYITKETLERFDAPIICSNFCKAVTLKEEKYFYNLVMTWNIIYDAGILFGFEGKTSGIKNLLFESFISSHKTTIPPIELAEKFYDFMQPIQINKEKNLKQNQELSSLRDWLLPMLMNGQVSAVSTSLSGNGGYVENEGGLGMVAEGKEIYRSSK